MEVSVLLIEFEGVLVDTPPLRAEALAEALAADGIALTAPLLRLAQGCTIEGAILRIRDAVGAPDDPTAVELARLRAERTFASRIGKGVQTPPGLRETLERLTTCGRLALVTRASRRDVEFILGLARLDGLFRPIIALEDADPPKPSPLPYRIAMDRMAALLPGQTLRGLAIEDTVAGIESARAAGLRTVLVGTHPPHDAMEADSWVETITALTPDRVRLLHGAAPKGAR